MADYKSQLEAYMLSTIERLEAPEQIKAAMSYSLQAGGKRIRPLLLFATIAACGKDPQTGMATAAALEMIHTYSLIHDDLPSMDDDDLRRGKPTNHKVFGEAMAILAGDGLLTYSFQLIAEDIKISDPKKIAIIKAIAQSAGPEGMVAGQVADIEGENKSLSISELESIHHRKTGRLLTFGVLAGAIIGEASNEATMYLEKFSEHLGLAFQIRDDILDVEGDENLIGKPIGSDVEKFKSTYPSLLTLQGAKEQLMIQINEAKKALYHTSLNTDILEMLTDEIATRNS